jgi:hypothetical protein
MRRIWLFVLFMLMAGSAGACAEAPSVADHLVSRPSPGGISVDGDGKDWADIAETHYLTGEQGTAGPVSFKVTHEPDGTLYILLVAPARLKRAGLFLDIEADMVFDRPVQYTYRDALKAAQKEHLPAATVAEGQAGETVFQEWRIDLALLGLPTLPVAPTGPVAPVHIGFDMEVTTEDGIRYAWGHKADKWLNSRRLRRLSLMPDGLGFGVLSGRALWADETVLGPPQRVQMRRAGAPRYSRVVATDPATGAFRAALPAGDYDVAALDTRSAPSLAVPVRVSVSADAQTDAPPLVIARPQQQTLRALVEDVMAAQGIKTLGGLPIWRAARSGFPGLSAQCRTGSPRKQRQPCSKWRRCPRPLHRWW